MKFEEMHNMIIREATSDQRIRAMTLEGSNVSAEAVHDVFSDFDVTFFVRDVREFVKERDYMERFGPILILQRPDEMDGYEMGSREKYTILTQYEDGNRIDLTFFDITQMEKQADFDEPRTVIINKDGFKELRDITTEEAFFVKPPSEKEYFDACNEFRWVSHYVTKGLCRRELYYVKYLMDTDLMVQYVKMLNWKIGADHDFAVTTGAYSKYLKRYLTEKEMEEFSGLFPSGDYEDIWEKIFRLCDAFAEAAEYVAEHLGFFFDEDETNRCRNFMESRRSGDIAN